MDDKKKILILGAVVVAAIGAAVYMGAGSMAGPPETIAKDASHLGDKGYDNPNKGSAAKAEMDAKGQ
jgi:hypothetical protein